MDKQQGYWLWKCRLIDPDITWEEYKTKYWKTTWSGKITHKSNNIKL